MKVSLKFSGGWGNACSMEYPINPEWVLYAKSRSSAWTEHSVVKMCVVDSIGSMWQCFNAAASMFVPGCIMFLMKEGHPPMWEHDTYKDLCIFSFVLPEADAIHCLREMFMYCCGGQCSDDWCGTTFQIQNRRLLVKIWHNHSRSVRLDELNQRITDLLSRKVDLSMKRVGVQTQTPRNRKQNVVGSRGARQT